MMRNIVDQMVRAAVPFVALITVSFTSTAAEAQPIKVACLGESSTHSAHRTNDPEYPELMGRFLDASFKLEPTPVNPLDGGMLYGGGTNYRIANLGLPTGTVLDSASTEVAPTIRSPQLTMAEQFGPQVVLLGPYGSHEPYAERSVDNFVPDLRALAKRVVAFPSQPTVFIVLPLPRWGEDGDALRRNIRDWTIQVAKELNLPQVDLWTEFLGKRAEFDDQNHLALEGRQRMGVFLGAVVKAYKPTGGGTADAGPRPADAGPRPADAAPVVDGGESDGLGPITGAGGAGGAGRDSAAAGSGAASPETGAAGSSVPAGGAGASSGGSIAGGTGGAGGGAPTGGNSAAGASTAAGAPDAAAAPTTDDGGEASGCSIGVLRSEGTAAFPFAFVIVGLASLSARLRRERRSLPR